jgi:Uma2 family endonuclease
MALVQAVDPRVSFAELQQWPEDGRRYELYDGEVIVTPAPYPRHQRVAQHVGELLREYELARGGLAFSVPIDIVFTKFDVLQPDVVFFLPERCSLVNMMQAAEVRPDLAIEVLSRSTEARDRGRKMQQLARFGVPEYWIVDPVRNTLEIHTRPGDHGYVSVSVYADGDTASSHVLTELTFNTRRLFQA